MRLQMLLGLILTTILLSLSAFGSPVVQAAKKNVCTITINSDEETLLFKKNLDAKDWNFIELTENALSPQDTDWLKRSCEKKIECDILLVSGHFGGMFFGKSNFNLAVDELESLSCDAKCDGILNKPKEVFLFGCNTLASKNNDRRTPEEYMQILLRDGFTHAQASQVVSFRYSGFGDSFKTKMTQIFAKTPRIYGFNSKGPSGKTIEPLLEKYLRNSKTEYSDFDQYISKQSVKPNNKFLEVLKNTSVVQATGSLLKMQKVEEKPYCYIRSSKITNSDKINYIEKLLNSGNGIQILSHIQNFLHNLKNNPMSSAAEKEALSRLGQNKKIKKDLMDLLKLAGDLYIPLKVNVIITLKDLEIISTDFAKQALNQILDLNSTFTSEKRDYLCSSELKVDITADVIPNDRWKEPEFITVLMCLRPNDPKILGKLRENLKSTDPMLVSNSIWALFQLKFMNEKVLLDIAKVLETPNLPQHTRFAAAIVLGNLKPQGREAIYTILRAIQSESDINIKDNLLRALRR